MRNRILASFCCALLLLVGREVWAAGAKPAAGGAKPAASNAKPAAGGDAGALFDSLDANHDGQLSAAEIPAEKRGLFDRLLRLAGKGADGQLSRVEFIAQLNAPAEDSAAESPADQAQKSPASTAGKKPGAEQRKGVNPERLFDRLDANHTGKITLDDVPEKRRKLIQRVFAEAGVPDSGSLTKSEFVKGLDAVLARRAANGKSARLGPALPANTKQLVKRLLKLSKRNDGKLTKDELPKRIRNRFDKIDTNHDGVIDEAELRTWIAKIKRIQAALAK